MRQSLQIDHVELFVPDRHEAARWYAHALGLEILEDYRDWAADAQGPLMISSDGGLTKLALFQGEPQGSRRRTAGFHRVAFRVDASGFIGFLQRLAELRLKDGQDRLVTPEAVVDHEKALSLYFVDPYGHRLEVTTYDYDAAQKGLGSLAPASG
jgi:catechol 2,3-dioxygenase-like lactoylglutathione lyase family enzyme